MPVAAAGARSHATLIAESGGKAWYYGNVTQYPTSGEKIQVAETWDGSILVRHFGVGVSGDSSATVQARADVAANSYESSAILLGRRT